MSVFLIFLMALITLHGLAHLSGLAAAWSRGGAGFAPQPWIFSRGVTLASSLGKAYSMVWLLAALTLAGAGLALIFARAAWPGLPLAGALLSLLAILPWWNAVPPGAKAGALLDVLILAALLGPWRDLILSALFG